MIGKKLIIEKDFEIRWVDMDAYQHLNNAKYYDLMSECRVASFFPFSQDCHYVVVENSCKYKKSVEYPARLLVKQYVQNISAVTFECVYIFMNADVEVAEGFAKMVCVNPETKKPRKIPEKLKNFFEQ